MYLDFNQGLAEKKLSNLKYSEKKLPEVVNLDISKAEWQNEGVKNLFWPIDRKSILPVRDILLDGFVPAVKPYEEKGDDVGLAAKLFSKWFFIDAIRLYIAICVHREFKKNGVIPISPERFEILAALQKGKLPTIQLSRAIIGTKPLYHDRLRLLKKIVRELQWNGFKCDLFKPFDPNKHVLTVQPGKMIIDHARSEKKYLKYCSLGHWFGNFPLNLLNDFYNSDDSPCFASLMDLVSNAFVIGKQDPPPWLHDYFSKWFSIAVKFANHSLDLLHKKRSYLPKQFWSGTVMSTVWLSVFAHAVRENGGKVIVHEHGTDTSHYEQNWHHFVTYSGCDEFYAPNRKSMKVRKDALKPEYFISGQPPQITCPQISSEELSIVTSREVTVNNIIKRILYVPTAFHGDRGKLRPFLSDIIYLDWQARLLSFLQMLNFEVFVKPHPEGQSKPPTGFAESFGFTALTKRFEQIDMDVDAYLIDYIASSTTAPILKSNKPVIFIDQNSPKLLPEAKKLIQKRCWYIHSWDDFDNRLQIDWNELKLALSAKEHTFDMYFAYTYLAGH